MVQHVAAYWGVGSMTASHLLEDGCNTDAIVKRSAHIIRYVQGHITQSPSTGNNYQLYWLSRSWTDEGSKLKDLVCPLRHCFVIRCTFRYYIGIYNRSFMCFVLCVQFCISSWWKNINWGRVRRIFGNVKLKQGNTRRWLVWLVFVQLTQRNYC
jgi:hypothetical protein